MIFLHIQSQQSQQTQRSKGSIIQLPNAATWLGIIPEQVLFFCASRFWNVDSNGACIHHPWGIWFFSIIPPSDYYESLSRHVHSMSSKAPALRNDIGLEVAIGFVGSCLQFPEVCNGTSFFPKNSGFSAEISYGSRRSHHCPKQIWGHKFRPQNKRPSNFDPLVI